MGSKVWVIQVLLYLGPISRVGGVSASGAHVGKSASDSSAGDDGGYRLSGWVSRTVNGASRVRPIVLFGEAGGALVHTLPSQAASPVAAYAHPARGSGGTPVALHAAICADGRRCAAYTLPHSRGLGKACVVRYIVADTRNSQRTSRPFVDAVCRLWIFYQDWSGRKCVIDE